MIAISSSKGKPLCHWENYFTQVYWYQNGPAAPCIWELAAHAHDKIESGYAAIINSDIFLGHNFSMLESALGHIHADAASSRRFQFDPSKPFPQKTKSVDLGLDIFIGTKHIWECVACSIPKEFRLGAPQWDTWLHGFLGHNFARYYDFSRWGCIFHPKHERKPWTGPIMNIPWEANDLGAPQPLPVPINPGANQIRPAPAVY